MTVFFFSLSLSGSVFSFVITNYSLTLTIDAVLLSIFVTSSLSSFTISIPLLLITVFISLFLSFFIYYYSSYGVTLLFVSPSLSPFLISIHDSVLLSPYTSLCLSLLPSATILDTITLSLSPVLLFQPTSVFFSSSCALLYIQQFYSLSLSLLFYSFYPLLSASRLLVLYSLPNNLTHFHPLSIFTLFTHLSLPLFFSFIYSLFNNSAHFYTLYSFSLSTSLSLSPSRSLVIFFSLYAFTFSIHISIAFPMLPYSHFFSFLSLIAPFFLLSLSLFLHLWFLFSIFSFPSHSLNPITVPSTFYSLFRNKDSFDFSISSRPFSLFRVFSRLLCPP
ncbi:unnamed protein product [Acanthosepion pharaonis]|uniref:Uncharacterized protein n=1 Tax=Acanthosepion pharaonis TaxID=158019 RepID=A0A812CAE3_ACAPH|nr:unnamed protein product [Sepia pharaonis]